MMFYFIQVSYIKVVDWFLLVCLLFVFAALLEYAFVVYHNSKNKENQSITEERESLRQEREMFLKTIMLKLPVSDGSSGNVSLQLGAICFSITIG